VLGASLAASATHGVTVAQAAPQLTWSDDFNGTSLDPSRWSYRATGARHDGYVTPDAVSVGGGLLTIKTYSENATHYTGMISTEKMINPLTLQSTGFEQTYGYFEARVKFNSKPGMWSAFWLQSPTNGLLVGNPQMWGVEMDIAEHRARCVSAAPDPTVCDGADADSAGGDADITNRIQQALVWDGYSVFSKSAVRLSDPLTGLANDSWHTWTLRWSPTGLTFYYDGVPTWTQAGPISQRSQYIILSSEVAQFFAGTIPAGGYGSRATSTTNMQVDYVRVWTLD
jgi:beta-glucanase (GH16 family)